MDFNIFLIKFKKIYIYDGKLGFVYYNISYNIVQKIIYNILPTSDI